MRIINRAMRLLILAFTLLPISVMAQQWDDKVIIANCADDYEIKMENGVPIVKNVEKITLESNSTAEQWAECSAFYGDCITLDRVTGADEKINKSFTPEGIFFDDTKICVTRNYLRKKGKQNTVTFYRTFKDIKYFTEVNLLENYFIRSKVVTIKIPKELSHFHLKEINFEGYNIKQQHTSSATEDIYTYQILYTNRYASEDANAPAFSHVCPSVLILGSFKEVNDFYSWSKKMQTVDCAIPNLQELLKEINVNSKTVEDRISNTYAWVQRNIRYVAFEAGISGQQPDKPAEVLRKRFGDCKGMALLLATLLKAQKIDAAITDIGTRDIPFCISDVPSLAAVNHSICTVFHNKKVFYLDATYNYIPWNYWPQSIQGSQAMIVKGDKPDLRIVPELNPSTSLDSLCYKYTLKGNHLEGTANYAVCGDMKEHFMRTIENSGSRHEADILTNNLNSDSHSFHINNVAWKDRDSRHKWSVFTGDVKNEVAIQSLDGETYIELNPHNDLFAERVDTTRRRSDFEFPIRCNVVRQVELTLPAGKKIVSLPKPFEIRLAGAILSCNFLKIGNKVIYHQKLYITRKRMPLADIQKWNDALTKWNDARNEQIILK